MNQPATGDAPWNRRTTAPSVRLIDRVARAVITVAGLGTVAAISLVFVFLTLVVIPLFTGSSTGQPVHVDAAGPPPSLLAVDEFRTLAWGIWPDGRLLVRRLDNGEVLAEGPLVEGAVPSALAASNRDGHVILGFPNGTVRTGTVSFRTELLEPDGVPVPLRSLEPEARASLGGGVLARTPDGRFRRQSVLVTLDDPAPIGAGASVELVDMTQRPAGPVIAALTSDGRLHLKAIRRVKNLMTGKTRVTATGGEINIPPRPDGTPPAHLLLSGVADTAYLVWTDGFALRFDTRDLSALSLAETLDLVPEVGARLTAIRFLIGKTTLLTGDSDGRIRAWFRIKPPAAATPDGSILVAAHEFPRADAGIAALAASQRSRLAILGTASGRVQLIHVTSGQVLADVATGVPVGTIAMAPKDDGIVGADARAWWGLHIDAPHPETTVASIFGPVWYEGYEKPEHVWQSHGGTDDFEPKLGLWPLIFGTLKATLYSMLFGAPLALLAAVFTSEFLHPRSKAVIKPAIEMMASLPSVVLGFLAALVIAPIVETIVPETLAFVVCVPLVFVAAGYFWLLLPRPWTIRLQPWRLAFFALLLLLAVGAAALVGPLMEDVLFAGDIMAWLDRQSGRALGGWWFLLLPFCALAVSVLSARIARPRLAQIPIGRTALAGVNLGTFLAGALLAGLSALALAWMLDTMGFDPRGGVLGTYVQRNALVVGIVMGFAIIPIIYTVSEDALSAVPEHLRAASLGAGATPWQTAVRIIVPTAMSGLFSAMMIGLGRAVGETMIVLMAAGNTPVLEWNLFNGFRSLSANIAVELPEAVQGGTQYRMLFLAALCLFLMTFAINTVAETIRLRFRKRAFEL